MRLMRLMRLSLSLSLSLSLCVCVCVCVSLSLCSVVDLVGRSGASLKCPASATVTAQQASKPAGYTRDMLLLYAYYRDNDVTASIAGRAWAVHGRAASAGRDRAVGLFRNREGHILWTQHGGR